MIEVLPIKVLTDEDVPIFGKLNVLLGKLSRSSIEVASGIVVTVPNLKLKTTLEHYNFTDKEVFEQSLTLVTKEIEAIPIPYILKKELQKHNQFLVNGVIIKSPLFVWKMLLKSIWLESIKKRLWEKGFYPGITESLDPQAVFFLQKPEAMGSAYFDTFQDEIVVKTKLGKIKENEIKLLDEIIKTSNKKLFFPHEYEWVKDKGLKIVGIKPYTPMPLNSLTYPEVLKQPSQDKKSTIKVFLNYTTGVLSGDLDGVFIPSEKLFDLNKPRESFDDLVYKLLSAASAYPFSPVLFKLADKSEGMGKVRGSLRLLHQQNLFNPLIEALDFVRHKKGFNNVHIVIPFVRGVNEFLQIKRELAVKKLARKASLKYFLEVAVPENIINLEDYLSLGVDGVVLNLDELISHLNGFDSNNEELLFYKNEANGLIKFLEDSIKLLHKTKIPFIAYGSLSLYPQVLEYLVEKGVTGIVVEKYEQPSAHELLQQVEKRIILKRVS